MFEEAHKYGEPDNMNKQEERVWSLIRVQRGAEKAISVGVLKILSGMSDRQVRMIVKDLIEKHGKPIGSTTVTPCGYWLIIDNKERKQVQSSLYRRAISILRRARAYESNPIRNKWVSDVVGQLALFEDKKNEGQV